MRKKYSVMWLLLVLFPVLMFLSGCETDGKTSQDDEAQQDLELTTPQDDQRNAGQGAEEDKEEDALPESDAAFYIDTADFAVSLLQENVREAEGNVMVSPVSVLTALAMTANGAEGNTLFQMLSVLAANQDLDSLNENLQAWAEGLVDTEGASLKIANSIWFDEKEEEIQVKESFLEKTATFFDAEVYQEPMDENTLNEINRWVLEKTDGHIERILDRISDDVVMYIINAAAFDAVWQETYQSSQIRDNTFTDVSQEEQTVSMMYSEESIYLEDENATGFIKPYQEGYSFVALLPKEGMTPEEYIKTLDGQKFLSLLSNAKTEVSVLASMPKFEAEYEAELSEILQTMGMMDAFDPAGADFSALATAADGRLSISRVIHKTHIAVDELGTKAGAATAVEMRNLAAIRDSESYMVYLDRPFVYAIIENQTNVPVFIGVVNTLP